MAIDKNTKELATAILNAKHIEHDEWLMNEYRKVINENAKFLTECLQKLKEKE